MKSKMIMLALVLALILSACAGGSANQPPVAEIDSISPANPRVGEEVVLVGRGVDQDGEVVSFEWRSSIDGKLGSSSFINTSSLSEGDHIIYFKVCDHEGACSEAATAKLVVSAKPVEVTAESAAEMVVEKVIEPLNPERPTIGFKLEDTLKPGDTIAAYRGEKRQVEGESYFFFVDLFPGAFYAHDVLFVLVDKDDGNIEVSQEEWWPMINDELPEWLDSEEAYWDEGNWFYSSDIVRPVGARVPPPQIGAPPIGAAPPQQQYQEAAVVVNGHAEGETLGWDGAMSAWEMWVLFDDFLTPDNTYDITPPPIGSNRPGDLFALLDRLCSEGYDHITVYIVGHGDIDEVSLGGTPMGVDELVDFISAHPETSFSFLLEACHIGSFIDDLSALSNVYLVLTATSTYFPSYGDFDPEIDPNPVDSGSEWTSSLYWSALEQLSGDGWLRISDEAARLSTPPSVVLLLSAFSNAFPGDSLGLDACYLSYMQFPRAWSPWGMFCNLWQQPPPSGDARTQPRQEQSGYVTSAGQVRHPSNYWFVGEDDTKRVFFSFPFPDDMPAGSTALVANMYTHIRLPTECELGYLGDLIIEHLIYGELDAGDFSTTSTDEVARIPVWHEAERSSTGGTTSVKSFFQQDFDSHRDYSQYRVRFTGDVELTIFSLLTIYYELR